MTRLLDLIGNTLSKQGLFPAISILALVLGGYGCYKLKRVKIKDKLT